MAMEKRYVLLDRDGTITVDKVYQTDPGVTELLPNAREGLLRLKRAGFGLVLVTNQSGVGRGYLTSGQVEAVNRSVEDLAGGRGFFDGMYHCPHLPADACACRKPEPGMALRAAADLGFDPARAFVIGDRECDMALARAVGAAAVLVRTGGGRETEARGEAKPDALCDDLAEAAGWILARTVAETGETE